MSFNFLVLRRKSLHKSEANAIGPIQSLLFFERQSKSEKKWKYIFNLIGFLWDGCLNENDLFLMRTLVWLCSLEVFDEMEFAKWVEKATAPAIGSSLKLYEVVQSLGFKTFLLTGRSENQRSVTVENLINAGFQNWDKLILRWVQCTHNYGHIVWTFPSSLFLFWMFFLFSWSFSLRIGNLSLIDTVSSLVSGMAFALTNIKDLECVMQILLLTILFCT